MPVCVCLIVGASLYMWHQSLLFHWCPKSGGSPAAWQIRTQDLCLCHPLIYPPHCAIICPLPTCADRWKLHWGVLDLHCTVAWRGTGSDRIRPNSFCACMCLGARKSYRYQRGFFGIFIFPTASALNLTTPYLVAKHFQAFRFKVIQVYLAVGNLSTVGKSNLMWFLSL